MKPLFMFYTATASLALGLMLAAPHTALGNKPIRRCGTQEPTRSEAERIEFVTQKALTGKGRVGVAAAGPAAPGGPRPPGSITVDVYFHVITSTDGKNGALTDAQVQSQIDMMNIAYSGKDTLPAGVAPLGPAANTPFRFVLKSIDRTANDNWFAGNADGAMKAALRKGNAKALNVYTSNIGSFGLLGYATFPWWYAGDPLDDGVVLAYDSLPGFPPPYGMGKTLVHETGHWLGLYHTFQGGCDKYNDFVADTAAEAYPFYGDWFPDGNYPATLTDTCTGKRFPGPDPADNYMDYSDDDSYMRFTAGQSARADGYARIYRGL